MNRKNKLLIQAVICLGIFVAVQSGVEPQNDKLGKLIDKVTEAIQENYTLAELLNLGEDAAETIAAAPMALGEAVVKANEEGMYGLPMDEDGDETVKHVYAVAGGRVIQSGIRETLGLFITVEHTTGKISTYGHLSDIKVVSGERIKKGDIIGSYDTENDEEFYYTLEDKSGE